MIHQFHEYFSFIFGGFLTLGTSVTPVRLCAPAAAAAVSTKKLKKTERKAPLLALALPLVTFVA